MTSGRMRAILMGAAVTLAGLSVQAQSSSDKSFLAKDSQGGLVEVEVAKLALKKTQNADVRAFAEKMVHDHEMLARNMMPFLQKDGVQPSTSLNSEHQKLYDKLNGLQGKDFDMEYVKAMDKDHHEDLSDFRSEFNSTRDMDLKTAVHKGEEVIAEHTRMIDALSAKMGMKPAGA